MNRFKFYIIASYILGLIFFLINNFNFEFYILIDTIIIVLILNIPSLIIGSIFYVVKKKLFWIFYGVTFFLISSMFILWTAIEIYTGSDWGKIL